MTRSCRLVQVRDDHARDPFAWATIADGRQNCQRRDGLLRDRAQRRNPLSAQAICDFRPPHVISATP